MKTPPLLLGAALVFWGWQAGFLIPGSIMAVVVEGSRLTRTRWEFSDEDFRRIWTLCSVLFLGVAVYAFTANEGPFRFGHMFQNPSITNQSGAGIASARTAIALFRWLPMIFFLFVVAQAYSSRGEIPWTVISQISRWRWKRAGKHAQALMAGRGVNVAFPYYALCLFAASMHPGAGSRYFWGFTVLVAWALWSRRPRRFGAFSWLATLAAALALGYAGQHGVGRMQSYLATLNPAWFSRFGRRGLDPLQSRMWLGRIGRLEQSGKIVIRLQPESGEPPDHLREASYSTFGSRRSTWSAPQPEGAFGDLNFYGTNATSWILLPGKTNDARVQIACYLEGVSPDTRAPMGLLPLPEGCGRLDNMPPFMILQTNAVGAVLAEGPGLLIFDAAYGPGATIDSPPNTNLDLAIPTNELPALDRVISQLGVQGQSTAGVTRSVRAFFQDNFTYTLWLRKPKFASTNHTPLSRFLLDSRQGHCEYFATATVLLLRRMNIPARYAVGYAVHEHSGSGYVVRQRDAHAWCIYWDKQSRLWRDLDTTPATWIAQTSALASPWQRLQDFWSWVVFQFEKFRWGQTHLRSYLLLGLVPVLVFLIYRILFQQKWRRRYRNQAASRPAPVPGLDSEFYMIEKKLARRGVLRRPYEPLSNWLERATLDAGLAEFIRPLQALLRLHYRYRFDPSSLNAAERDELRRGSVRMLDALSQFNRAPR